MAITKSFFEIELITLLYILAFLIIFSACLAEDSAFLLGQPAFGFTIDNFDKPNGIVFSPNEKYLYVADSGAAEPGNIDFNKPHHVKRYNVDINGNLSNEIIFCEIEEGFPDGMSVDIDGNLFICDPHGHRIHIYESSGDFIGNINIPERVANCTFGGENNSLLYITASTSLYLLETGTKGR